jgi:two-component system LytT family response regulator
MIKAIIVDDEPSAGEVLQTLIKGYTPHINVCAYCQNIPQAIAALEKYKPNILFLDIELADGSGFEVLENLNGLEVRVVFVTAYEHYAVQAIKYNAFDYILKPIMPQELNETIDKIFDDELTQKPYPDINPLLKQVSGGLHEKIGIKNREGLEYYSIKDILYVEGQGSYIQMFLTGGESVLVSKKIKDFEVILDKKGFLRVHKSYYINITHIAGVLKESGGFIKMTNGKEIPISNTYKENALKVIKNISNIV